MFQNFGLDLYKIFFRFCYIIYGKYIHFIA